MESANRPLESLHLPQFLSQRNGYGQMSHPGYLGEIGELAAHEFHHSVPVEPSGGHRGTGFLCRSLEPSGAER